MKKSLKIVAGAAAALAVAGIATASVMAWGDNGGGRRTYTIAEINKGVLGDTITFNSISDQAELKNKDNLTDERYFVGARLSENKDDLWSSNVIEVQEGKTYTVRLYVHNNNPNGTKAVAKDVTTTFSLGQVVDKEQRVDGTIYSSNATPTKYYDSVVFKSADGRKFYLDYIEGSAILGNNGIGSVSGGLKLSDDIVKSGVKIGYDALDGNIPGCYQYASYVGIQVKPVFEDSSIQKTVRLKGEKGWNEYIDAKVGDEVEFQIHYKNLNEAKVNGVIIRDSLPDNLEYVKGSTTLYNASFPNGASTNDETLVTDGVNVGNYDIKGDAYVRFIAKVVDTNLACGQNRLINWAKATANNFAVQDSAEVYVKKACEEQKKPTPKPTTLPETGAGSIAAGALGTGAVVTTAGYFIASRKNRR